MIFTIGYEGMSLDGFIQQLRTNDIELLIDVREYPLSRKPGFSKLALANTLNMFGIRYEHQVRLGCPKPIRDGYKVDKNWANYTTNFLRYLGTQDEAIEQLANNIKENNCALMCFEADPAFCHRSLVAKSVAELTQMKICHLGKDSKPRTTKPAPLAQGQLWVGRC